MLLIFLLITLICTFSYSFENIYNIKGIYKKEGVPFGSVVINPYGTVEEIDYFLLPAEIDIGIYKVFLKKISTNVYEVIGKNIILIVKQELMPTYKNKYNLSFGESLIDLEYSSLLFSDKGILVTSQ